MKDIKTYNYIIREMRRFFQDEKGFIEVPTQARLSILAACEDPKTITQFIFNGINYPLPQTGQVWLEHELLTNPDVNGVFCVSTSYRNEPFPIEGRHDKIFPMFEFESKGDVEDLKNLEKELVRFLGLKDEAAVVYYEDACQKYNTDTLDADHEEMLQKDFGNNVILEKFPQRSHPFWNMKQISDTLYNKVDVLLYGMETIGSAERSCDVEQMYNNFMSVSDGKYSQLLFSTFTKNRVMRELETYLALPMFPRFGGGIGVTRMERAMKLAGIFRGHSRFHGSNE